MGGGGGLGGLASGMGNAFVGASTFGAYTPNGRGWAQGNDPLNAFTYGASGGLIDTMGDNQKLNDLLRSIPNFARPQYPGYQSLLENNKLPQQFQLNPNTQGLDKLKSETMSAAPSPWAAAQVNQINSQKGNTIAANGMQAQSNARQANSALAGSTGLSGAAQRRIQEMSQKSKMLANQAASRQAMTNTQNVLTTDAQQKDTNLAALPQMQLQALAPQQTNIENTLTQKSARDMSDLERYKTEMQSWATANTASAIQKSGGGGKK